MNNEVDLKLKVSAEADAASFEAVRRETDQLQPETPATGDAGGHAAAVQEQAAAVRDLQTALEGCTQAQQQQQTQQEALRMAMELEGKSAAALKAEMERLAAARKAAAAAGDVAVYGALKTQYEACKRAAEQLRSENQLGGIALMQQAQTGMQVAQTLGGLADKVRDGSVSMGDFAGAIMSVSMALKAGLGPIGWVMTAVQGLQMAWDWYSDSQEKAEAVEQQRVEALVEAERRHAEALDALAAAQRKLLLDDWSRQTEELKREGEELAAANARTRAAAEAAAQREDAAARQAAETRAAAERDALELMQVRGEIGEKEAEDRLRRVEEQKAAGLAAIEAAAAARQNANERAARDDTARQADALEQALAETYGKFENVLKVQMPTEQEWNVLQAKLDAGRQSLAEMRFSEQVHRDADEVRRVLEELGVHVAGGTQDILAFLDNVRAAKAEGERDVQALRQQADAHAEGARAALAEREALAAQHAEEQRAAAARQGIADAREEQRRVEEEWADVSRRSLAEQQAWLTAQVAQVQEGSELWKKYTAQLRGVKTGAVAKELGALAETYRVSGNYARQDTRTQQQILQADGEALQARRTALQHLLAVPDLDAGTVENINRALAETEGQINGLREAEAKNAEAARGWLSELQPPKLQGKSKMATAQLQRLAAEYKRAADKAAKAAEKGDAKSLAAAERQMGNYARAMQKLAAQPRVADKMHRQAQLELRAAARSAKSGAAAEKKAAAAAKNKAAATEKAAQAAKETIPKGQEESSRVQELSAKVDGLEAGIKNLSASIRELSGKISSLGSAAAQAAAAAANAASAAGAADASIRKELKRAQDAIERLRRNGK